MGRTRKLRLKGGSGGGKKRKADVPASDSRPDPAKKTRSSQDIEAAGVLAGLPSPAIQVNPCVDTVHASYMGYHLKADMIHDFGPAIEASISDLHGISVPNSITESTVVDYFKMNFPALNAEIRKNNIIDFTLSEKTSLFPQAGVEPIFKPFSGIQNLEIGILQDAGVQLYRLLNATNLITFGSILDQASKPVEDAFYFKADGVRITFPACTFGFNPRKVKDISISGFNGQSVDCKFQYFTGAGAGAPIIGGTEGVIQMNQQKGDFVSIARVDERADPVKKHRGVIGKALGDILLVASLMPHIGMMANTLCPPPVATLTSVKGDKTRTIKKVMFNTGDQLAHIRAYAFGIPTVYSLKTSGGIRNFNYIPGTDTELSAEELERHYTGLSSKILEDIEKAYTDLLSHLDSLIVDEKFDIQKSLKSGLPLIPDNVYKQGYAGKLITLLIKNIKKIKEIVILYCRNKIEGKSSEFGYKELLKEAGKLLPSSTTTLARNGRDASLLLNVLRPATDIPEIPKGSYTFYISEVYQLIGKGSNILEPRLTKIFTMFGDAMPARVGGVSISGGDKEGFDVFGLTFTAPTDKIKLTAPLIEPEYLEESYLVDASGMKSNEILEAYETYLHDPDSILDPILLESLYTELNTLMKMPTDISRRESRKMQTKSSLRFNEFACRFNATIAGEDTELGIELLGYASNFESLLRSLVDTGFTTPSSKGSLSSNEGTRTHHGTPTRSFADEPSEHSAFISPSNSQLGTKLSFLGGQRVARANFSIDATKSFVKTGGAPSSEVK